MRKTLRFIALSGIVSVFLSICVSCTQNIDVPMEYDINVQTSFPSASCTSAQGRCILGTIATPISIPSKDNPTAK